MKTVSPSLPSGAVIPALRGPSRKTFRPQSRFGTVGIGVMVAAHLLLAYGLATGLGGKAIEVIKKPLQATIVQEVQLPPPPPPPPPPKIEKVADLPKMAPVEAPPPPSYVPPPEVATPQAPVEAAIATVQHTQAVPTPPTPAPVVPAPVPAAPARVNIAVACPTQVAPVMPARALSESIEGTVKAQARIVGGQVVDVKILSGPSVFHAAVRSAMQAYKCSQSAVEVVASQDFTFQLD